jgi:hypothetical protein
MRGTIFLVLHTVHYCLRLWSQAHWLEGKGDYAQGVTCVSDCGDLEQPQHSVCWRAEVLQCCPGGLVSEREGVVVYARVQ